MSPSDVFTPWSRRFGDEGQRSLDELRALYEQVSQRYAASLWASPCVQEVVAETVLKSINDDAGLAASSPLAEPLTAYIQELLAAETQIFEPMEADFSAPIDLLVRADLLERLRERARFLDDEDGNLILILKSLREASEALANNLPNPPRSGLTVPLFTLLGDLPQVIHVLIRAHLTKENEDAHLFQAISDTLFRNICRVSGVNPEASSSKPLVSPVDSDLSPEKLVYAYLGDTPLHDLVKSAYPFELPAEQRFAGHWVIAPPGRGKTTLLHAMVADDIRRDAAIILMDSKGDLIEPFRRMKSIADRLIIIEPDPTRPIAINPH